MTGALRVNPRGGTPSSGRATVLDPPRPIAANLFYFAIDSVSGHLYPQSTPTPIRLRAELGKNTLHPDDDAALPAARSVALAHSRLIVY